MPRPYAIAAAAVVIAAAVHLLRDNPPGCDSVTVKASEVDPATESGRAKIAELQARNCDKIIVDPD